MIAKSFAKKALKATNQVARVTRSAARLAGRNRRFLTEVATADMQALTQRAIRGVAKVSQPRRQPKGQTPPMVRQTTTAMPVAFASETTMSAPVQRKTPLGAELFIATAPPVLRVNNANFGEIGFADSGSKYRVFQYPLNPLCANFWQNVADRVKQYKKYTVESLKLDWAPNLPSTATGNVVLVYYSDPNTPPPSSFQIAQMTPESITAQVAKEWSKSFNASLLKCNLTAPLTVGPPATNLPTGPVPQEQEAINRQNTQGVLYVCMGPIAGTTAPLLPESEIGRLSMSFRLMAIDSSTVDVAYTANNYTSTSLNVDHTGATPLQINSAFFTVGSDTRSIYFKGGNSKYDIDFTYQSLTPLPTNIFELLTINGTNRNPDSVFSILSGTMSDTVDTYNTVHFDGTITLTYGDHIVFDTSVMAQGKFSLSLVPVPGGLVAAF